MWCVPELTVEYVARMENVLKVLERKHNPKAPVICLDEKPVQLLKEKNAPVAMSKTQPVMKRDYEYERHGTANIFVAVEPKTGRFFVEPTAKRKACDFASMLQKIERSFAQANTIHLVLDNLSTHSKNSLVKAFGTERGNALWARFTVHFTPKHASWLNPAEIGISMLSRQVLRKGRCASLAELKSRTKAWRRHTNKKRTIIQWMFTRKKARKVFRYENLVMKRSKH